MKKIHLLWILCCLTTISLAFDAAAKQPTPKSKKWVESDPVFAKHPSNKLSDSDVKKVKSIDELIDDTVNLISDTVDEMIRDYPTTSSALPILDAPPENAVPGDRYINSGSGAICYYVSKKALDTWLYEWASTPDFFQLPNKGQDFLARYTSPCRACNSGAGPKITFPNSEQYEAIITTIGTTAKFEMEISGADYYYIDTYLVRNIDDNWVFVSQTHSDTLRFAASITGVNPITMLIFYTNKYIVARPENLGFSIPFDIRGGLSDGLYGIIFTVYDNNNNRYTSEVAPIKIQHTP